jgi:hypothetical protein
VKHFLRLAAVESLTASRRVSVEIQKTEKININSSQIWTHEPSIRSREDKEDFNGSESDRKEDLDRCKFDREEHFNRSEFHRKEDDAEEDDVAGGKEYNEEDKDVEDDDDEERDKLYDFLKKLQECQNDVSKKIV